MKRLSVVLILALLAGVVGGCRFIVVEGDSMRVAGLSALAESEGETLFDIPERAPLATLTPEQMEKLVKAVEEGVKDESTHEVPEESGRDSQTPTVYGAYYDDNAEYLDDDIDEPESVLSLAEGDDAADPDGEASGADGLIGLRSRDEAGESGVRRLQQALVDLGYLTIEPDGEFGSRTLKALKRFQADSGLEETGVLDEATERALFPAPTVTTAPEDVLYSKGASGREIQRLQRALALYGFTDKAPTGKYDADTEAAVMTFQVYAVERYGTEFDDPIDALDLPAESTLVESRAELPSVAPTPAPAETALPEMPALAPAATLRPHHALDGVVSENLFAYLTSDRFPVYRSTVQRGDEGDEVARVQRRLIVLGFFYDEPDGTYGENTVNAVKAFQHANGLQETGIAGEETQRDLFSTQAISAEKVDQPFYIKVSLAEQRVYIYRWQDGGYNQLIKTMICSSGYGNLTPRGVFVSPGHRDARWHYFAEYHCWAQYAFVIKGSILFHSVIYSRRDEASLRVSTLRNLGHKASHGCVRLKVEDARWIYEHCGAGQVIEIY